MVYVEQHKIKEILQELVEKCFEGKQENPRRFIRDLLLDKEEVEEEEKKNEVMETDINVLKSEVADLKKKISNLESVMEDQKKILTEIQCKKQEEGKNVSTSSSGQSSKKSSDIRISSDSDTVPSAVTEPDEEFKKLGKSESCFELAEKTSITPNVSAKTPKNETHDARIIRFVTPEKSQPGPFSANSNRFGIPDDDSSSFDSLIGQFLPTSTLKLPLQATQSEIVVSSSKLLKRKHAEPASRDHLNVSCKFSEINFYLIV